MPQTRGRPARLRRLPGGQDHYSKTISELAAAGGFTGEELMEISKKFDTNVPAAH